MTSQIVMTSLHTLHLFIEKNGRLGLRNKVFIASLICLFFKKGRLNSKLLNFVIQYFEINGLYLKI